MRSYEDPRALLGDPPTDSPDRKSRDGLGLTFYRHIAQLASNPAILDHNGLLVLEVGHTQSAAVMDILKTVGITRLRVWEDARHQQRVVVGRVG